jgi:Ca2+/Na+ antiporter
MGYFDGLTDASFKKDSAGNSLFYPWGALGSGYIIESDESKNHIRGQIKTTYVVIIPLIIIVQVTVGVWLNAILLPVFVAWYIFYVKKMTKTLKKSDEKLTVKESVENSAKSHNLMTLILLLIISLGFVSIAVILLISKGSHFVPYAAIAMFGPGVFIFTRMIKHKLSDKKQLSGGR